MRGNIVLRGGGIITIGNKAFYSISKLRSVYIGKNVKSIGESVFEECGLHSLNIPDSVISIGRRAFWFNRPIMSSLHIGENLNDIGEYAFEDCNIDELIIDSENLYRKLGSNDDGSLRSYYGTRAIYNRFLDKNKLPRKEFHFHALRHTFGTILKDNEENILNIQLLLRHASAKTTENYLSTTNQQILSFKNRLDNVFENDLKQYERKTRKKSKDFEM